MIKIWRHGLAQMLSNWVSLLPIGAHQVCAVKCVAVHGTPFETFSCIPLRSPPYFVSVWENVFCELIWSSFAACAQRVKRADRKQNKPMESPCAEIWGASHGMTIVRKWKHVSATWNSFERLAERLISAPRRDLLLMRPSSHPLIVPKNGALWLHEKAS